MYYTYVYTYMHMHMCVYTFTKYTCIHTYMYFVYIHLQNMHVYIHTCILLRTHTYTHVCICVYTYIHTCVLTRLYIRGPLEARGQGRGSPSHELSRPFARTPPARGGLCLCQHVGGWGDPCGLVGLACVYAPAWGTDHCRVACFLSEREREREREREWAGGAEREREREREREVYWQSIHDWEREKFERRGSSFVCSGLV